MSASPTDTDTDLPAPPSGEEIPTPDTEAQLAATNDRLLRLAADFENFKKRSARDRDDARRLGAESVLGKLLPVLDNFDMAMVAAAQPTTTLDTLRIGVNMIHGQLRSLLSDLGVKELDPVGQPFDPSLHEAVSVQESSEVPEGHVAQLTRKGYQLGDRLLRPASVVVATKSDSETNPS